MVRLVKIEMIEGGSRTAPTKEYSQLELVSLLGRSNLLYKHGNTMEAQLGHLAARWRGAKKPHEAKAILREYQNILRQMIQLGYQDSLDVDAELPDEYMPDEYLALHS